MTTPHLTQTRWQGQGADADSKSNKNQTRKHNHPLCQMFVGLGYKVKYGTSVKMGDLKQDITPHAVTSMNWDIRIHIDTPEYLILC